jgi:hypothetical protein
MLYYFLLSEFRDRCTRIVRDCMVQQGEQLLKLTSDWIRTRAIANHFNGKVFYMITHCLLYFITSKFSGWNLVLDKICFAIYQKLVPIYKRDCRKWVTRHGNTVMCWIISITWSCKCFNRYFILVRDTEWDAMNRFVRVVCDGIAKHQYLNTEVSNCEYQHESVSFDSHIDMNVLHFSMQSL